MSTTKFADDVLVSVELSPSGTPKSDNSPCLRILDSLEVRLMELGKADGKMTSKCSLPKSSEEVNIYVDGKYCQNKEAAGTTFDFSFGTGENDKANAQRSCMPFRYFCLDKITMLWPETRLPKEMEKLISAINSSSVSSVKSADQHNIDIDGKHYQNKEAAGIAINCGFGTSENEKANRRFESISGPMESELTHLLISDITENVKSKLNSSSQTMASKMNVNFDVKYCQKKEDSYLEVLLMVSSFLLSFASSGAFYFIQALSIVGFHDQLLKHSLVAFKWVFAASFFCNFLGVLTCLILQSRREYHSFKKFSLIISNTVSFLLMVIGYGLLISFNIQRR